MSFPDTGADPDEVLDQLRRRRADDADWRSGRSWSLVYWAGDDHTSFLGDAYLEYFSENGLSPTAFPSLGGMERDVVSMLIDLLDGDPAAAGGSMTSGSTESTILAMKAYRDRARAAGVNGRLSIVAPITVHPAFAKAAHLLDLEFRTVAVDVRPDESGPIGVVPDDLFSCVDHTTIAVACSAPCFPFGAFDPVAEIAARAHDVGVGCHVDGALGGIVLPVLERAGHDVPHLGLDIAGLTSIGVDLHKYGFAAKGAAAVLYSDPDLRRHQYYAYLDWPGGVLASPGLLGTRPGGSISAAWAAINRLGLDGYTALFELNQRTAGRLRRGIESVPGLQVIGRPPIGVFAFMSASKDIWAIADILVERGWRIDRQADPPSIHLIVNPQHADIVDCFIGDLRDAADVVSAPRQGTRGSALYGVTTTVNGGDDPERAVIGFLDDQLNGAGRVRRKDP